MNSAAHNEHLDEEWEDDDDLDILIEKEHADIPQNKKSQGLPRRQYTREYKLRAIRYTQKHTLPWKDSNGIVCQPISKYKAAQKFRITPTMLRKWMRNAKSILHQLVGQRRNNIGRKALLPELELALFNAFKTLRESGSKVKVSWFLITARKLFEKYYPQQIYNDERGKKQ